MLFDWLLPVLTKQATPRGSRLTAEQLTAILMALRNCLSGNDACLTSASAPVVAGMLQRVMAHWWDVGSPRWVDVHLASLKGRSRVHYAPGLGVLCGVYIREVQMEFFVLCTYMRSLSCRSAVRGLLQAWML